MTAKNGWQKFWSRVVTGDGMRKTRFHTYSGNRIDWRGVPGVVRSCSSLVTLKLFGHWQPVPWLGYRAIKHLDSLIRPDWSILEFGSGMSSLFFAQRCSRLVSIESDPAWFDRMRALLASKDITNVDYRFRSEADYTSLDDLADHSFDLVIVDGIARDREAIAAVQKVKPGGYVFFDNSDVPYTEHREARHTLTAAAVPGTVRIFNDFYPFQISVNESLIVKITGTSETVPG